MNANYKAIINGGFFVSHETEFVFSCDFFKSFV